MSEYLRIPLHRSSFLTNVSNPLGTCSKIRYQQDGRGRSPRPSPASDLVLLFGTEVLQSPQCSPYLPDPVPLPLQPAAVPVGVPCIPHRLRDALLEVPFPAPQPSRNSVHDSILPAFFREVPARRIAPPAPSPPLLHRRGLIHLADARQQSRELCLRAGHLHLLHQIGRASCRERV